MASDHMSGTYERRCRPWGSRWPTIGDRPLVGRSVADPGRLAAVQVQGRAVLREHTGDIVGKEGLRNRVVIDQVLPDPMMVPSTGRKR